MGTGEDAGEDARATFGADAIPDAGRIDFHAPDGLWGTPAAAQCGGLGAQWGGAFDLGAVLSYDLKQSGSRPAVRRPGALWQFGADRYRPDGQVCRGTPRRTLAALKACKTKTANNDVAGRIGFAPVRMAV